MTFKNDHVSVSRLKLYERCALAFFYSYVEKGWTEIRGAAADFGVCLHDALETVFRWVIEEEYTGLFPIDIMIGAYKESWRKTYINGGNVSLFQDGLIILRAYAERHGKVDHLKIIDVEKEFNLQIDEFIVNGYIDRVEKMGDDGVLIVDYKSGQHLYTKDELDTDLQAATYLLVAKTLYPWAKQISFAFDMLRFNVRQGVPDRTSEEIEDARHYIVTLGRKTETDETWKAQLNPLCGWCDHRGRCPEYAKAVKEGRALTKIATLTGIEEIAAEREQVAKMAKLLYGRKEDLDKLLKAKLTQDGEFDAANTHYRFQNSFNTTYPDPERVIQVFSEYAGLNEAEVRKRVYGIDAAAVKALKEEVTKDLGTSLGYILDATLTAISIKVPQTPKIDARPLGGAKNAKSQKAADLAKEAKEKEGK